VKTDSLSWSQEERRETNEAHETRVVVCRQIDCIVDGCVLDGRGTGKRGPGAGSQHDDGSGNRVSGERSAWHRDAGGELAIVHYSKRSTDRGGQYDGGDYARWIFERESGS